MLPLGAEGRGAQPEQCSNSERSGRWAGTTSRGIVCRRHKALHQLMELSWIWAPVLLSWHNRCHNSVCNRSRVGERAAGGVREAEKLGVVAEGAATAWTPIGGDSRSPPRGCSGGPVEKGMSRGSAGALRRYSRVSSAPGGSNSQRVAQVTHAGGWHKTHARGRHRAMKWQDGLWLLAGRKIALDRVGRRADR